MRLVFQIKGDLEQVRCLAARFLVERGQRQLTYQKKRPARVFLNGVVGIVFRDDNGNIVANRNGSAETTVSSRPGAPHCLSWIPEAGAVSMSPSL